MDLKLILTALENIDSNLKYRIDEDRLNQEGIEKNTVVDNGSCSSNNLQEIVINSHHRSGSNVEYERAPKMDIAVIPHGDENLPHEQHSLLIEPNTPSNVAESVYSHKE